MSAPPRIGLIGDGKMARAIAQLAAERGIRLGSRKRAPRSRATKPKPATSPVRRSRAEAG